MKRKFIPAVLFFVTMTLAVSVFAKDKSADIKIYQTSQVAGTTLQPGDYKVTLNTTGSTANVIFAQNGKQVATASGQAVQLSKKSNNTAVTVDNSGSVPTISEIDLAGSQTAVSFTSTANASVSGE